MAKVSGPLMSMTASGKIADALVFFPWKGIAAVRQWLKPANPMQPAQGIRRILMGGTGRACGRISPRTGSTTVSWLAKELILLKLIPSAQTKQSFLVQYILDHYITGSTSYALQLSAATNLTAKTTWQACADVLQLLDFNLSYAGISAYEKTLGLYLIAKACVDLKFPGTPYTTDPSTWTLGYICGFINDFTSAV